MRIWVHTLFLLLFLPASAIAGRNCPPSRILKKAIPVAESRFISKSVVVESSATKSLNKFPPISAKNLERWIAEVKANGLAEVRKRPGYHDEPLYSKVFTANSTRSIRLNDRVRDLYFIETHPNGEKTIHVTEVTNHYGHN